MLLWNRINDDEYQAKGKYYVFKVVYDDDYNGREAYVLTATNPRRLFDKQTHVYYSWKAAKEAAEKLDKI